MKPGMKFFRVIGAAAAVYVIVCILNLLLGVYIWFPRFEWRWIFIPLPESAAAALILLGISGLARRPATTAQPTRSAHISESRARIPFSAHFFLLLFTVLFLLLLVFSAVEAFFQHVYVRTFDIRANIPLLSHFFNMLFDTELFFRPLFLIFPSVLVFSVFAALLWALFRYSTPVIGHLPRRPSLTIAAAIFLFSVIAAPAQPAAVRLIEQLFFYEQRLVSAAVPDFDHTNSYGSYFGGKSGYALPGIEDKNIHLCIVESYGTTVFTNPHHFARLERFYEQQASLLQQAGFAVFSHAYASTAFGGTSWLADATILSGIEIRSQSHYDRVVKSGTENVLKLFAEAGYRTILSAPGSKFMTEEYTGFYDYDTYVLHEDFEYTGPFFTFGKLPDQYQLHYIHSQIIDHSSPQPHFAQYILCSSHVPWNYIPPYIASWSGFNGGRVYYDRSKNTWYDNSWALGSELFEGYAHSIRYSLESVFGYARAHMDENDIMIVIGDHQPKFPVSEREAGFGVPVHILTKDRRVLLPLIRFGYREGIMPPKLAQLPGLQRFLGHFLSVAEGRSLNPRPADAPLNIPK